MTKVKDRIYWRILTNTTVDQNLCDVLFFATADGLQTL